MVDANLLVRQFLLAQPAVTSLLGANANSSIYCSYDLPEHFDPSLGPAIQIFRLGGHTHEEIKPLVEARVHVRVWADCEQELLASMVYAAINDTLHGACNVGLPSGTIVNALEVTGPLEITDPETGWVGVYAFYSVLGSSQTGPGVYVPRFYEAAGAPGVLENNEDVYYDQSTGNLYEQVQGAWLLIGNLPTSGGGTEMPSLTYHKVAAASTNAANIKAVAGTVTGWKIYNDTEYPIYVKLFDKNTVPIPGTDTPKQTIGIDAGVGEVTNSAGFIYTTGIGIAITKGILDNDPTPVAAGDCVVDIFYQ